jgi:hypothetical protein
MDRTMSLFRTAIILTALAAGSLKVTSQQRPAQRKFQPEDLPAAKNQSDNLKALPDGVLPAVDAVISRGIADPDRVALAGQSDGGFATLGLITETNRFRSAIESTANGKRLHRSRQLRPVSLWRRRTSGARNGDLDFIPIQQDEEFFTVLLRRDKRAEFVRYQGEGHTISSRANVLDLWKRATVWLAATMAPRK